MISFGVNRLWAFALVLIIFACNSPVNRMPDHPGYMDSAIKKAHLQPSDGEQYFNLIASAYHSLPNPGPGDLWEKATREWGYYYFDKKDYDKALVYADSLLDLSRENNNAVYDAGLYAKALFFKGDVLLASHHYDEAFDWYYQGQQVIYQTNDTCTFEGYTSRLAMVSYVQKKYARAIAYYKQALDEAAKCPGKNAFEKFINKQGTLDNIGINFSRLGLADSASVYFAKALDCIAAQQAQFKGHATFIATAVAVIKGNQADVAIQTENDSAALRLLQESISINSRPENAPEDAVYSRVKLIKLYLKHAKLPEASRVLKDCATAMDTIRNVELTQKLYQLQAEWFSASDMPGQAYATIQKYIKLRDSVAAATLPITATDIHNELELIGKKNQLLLLQQRNKLQSVYLVILLVVGSMGAVIIVLVLKNSRQSKKHIRLLTDTLEALEKSQQEHSRLMAIVAHDLRNPIGAITSFIGLMLDEDKNDDSQKRMLQLMHASGNNALQLITDLMLFNPSKSNTAFETLDLEELLQYCVTLLKHKASEKKQQIVLQTVPVMMAGDRGKLWRVFSNIIGNAIKFSPQGATVKITMLVKQTAVQIVIEDSGIGIPAHLQQSIFEVSVKAKRKSTDGEPSFGLGLLISRQVVEQHDGKIWFTSQEGQGAIFYVELPLTQPAGK